MTLYGDYETDTFLGKGSIGKVYLARHRRIGRKVALKTVQLDQKFEDEHDRAEFHKRLQREAELCASLQHPNIVTLYEVGYEGDLVSWLATEYVDGESLLARLRKTRPLQLEKALQVAADLLRGLAYAHTKGVIHRDIKPANILLTAGGEAKIADFGIARPLHSSLTASRSLLGTPNYMSPEQVKTTPVSTRSDLFSAGAVMYEMLTGLKPFAAPELSGVLYNVVNLIPPPVNEVNPAVPVAVAQLVARLLEKKPEKRYATADEALAELERVRSVRVAGYETIAISPADATTPLPTSREVTMPDRAPWRRPVPALLFWAVTLLLLGALIASIVQLRRAVIREAPSPEVITEQQIEETAAKRRLLGHARALTRSGQYELAIRLYDNFIDRYPGSLAAAAGREEAQRLLDESTRPKSEITRVARKPRPPKKVDVPEPEKKPSRWQRFKRWFRGN